MTYTLRQIAQQIGKPSPVIATANTRSALQIQTGNYTVWMHTSENVWEGFGTRGETFRITKES